MITKYTVSCNKIPTQSCLIASLHCYLNRVPGLEKVNKQESSYCRILYAICLHCHFIRRRRWLRSVQDNNKRKQTTTTGEIRKNVNFKSAQSVIKKSLKLMWTLATVSNLISNLTLAVTASRTRRFDRLKCSQQFSTFIDSMSSRLIVCWVELILIIGIRTLFCS